MGKITSEVHQQSDQRMRNILHVIKDFISSLQCNIRNKIANKWKDLWNPPHTVQEAFDLAIKTETQIKIANSFKLELSSYPSPADVNEINIGNISGDEFEVNKVSRGRKWNNNYKKDGYNNSQNYNSNNQYNSQNQDKKPGNKWVCKERDFQDHSST